MTKSWPCKNIPLLKFRTLRWFFRQKYSKILEKRITAGTQCKVYVIYWFENFWPPKFWGWGTDREHVRTCVPSELAQSTFRCVNGFNTHATTSQRSFWASLAGTKIFSHQTESYREYVGPGISKNIQCIFKQGKCQENVDYFLPQHHQGGTRLP